MAVLNKIRERSVFLIIIIALALFSFVLADVIRNGGFSASKSQNTIATVNGEELDRKEFALQVENLQSNPRRRITTMQAVNQVWNAQIRALLLQQQMEELGIQVGQQQINQLFEQQLAGDPRFSDENGFFNFGAMREYVANLKATSPEGYQQWINYENNVAQSAKADVYFNMIKAGLGATAIEGKRAYQLENESINLQYVLIPYSSIDSVNIGSEVVAAYVEEHPEQYQVEASRDIQYVMFQEKPSTADEKAIKEELLALLENRVEYNAASQTNDTIRGLKNTENPADFINRNSDIKFQDRFVFKNQLPKKIADSLFQLEEGAIYGPYKNRDFFNLSKVVEIKQVPDSAKASHILISYQGLRTGIGLDRTEEEAKKLADSLLSVVRENPKKFGEIAAQYSADNSNKNKGGDLGWFPYGRMVPKFNEFVFSQPVGKTGLVKTDFGFHIVSVEEQTEEQKAIKLATLSREINPSEKTLNQLYTKATSFQMAASETGFNQAVKKDTALTARPVKTINVLDANLPGMGPQRAIVNWAFEESTEIGAIKRFDVNAGYIVAQLTGKTPKGLMPTETAAATVKPILIKEKKAERIKNKISGGTLSEIASNQGVQVKSVSSLTFAQPNIPGAGNEPKVVGRALALEKGKISEPISGEKGVYVVKVTGGTEVPELASYATIAAQETEERTSKIGAGNGPVVEALKESAEIEDNRASFY